MSNVLDPSKERQTAKIAKFQHSDVEMEAAWKPLQASCWEG